MMSFWMRFFRISINLGVLFPTFADLTGFLRSPKLATLGISEGEEYEL